MAMVSRLTKGAMHRRIGGSKEKRELYNYILIQINYILIQRNKEMEIFLMSSLFRNCKFKKS